MPQGHPVEVSTKSLAEVLVGADIPRQAALGIAMQAIDRSEKEWAAAAESMAWVLSGDLLQCRAEEPGELARIEGEI